MALDPRVVGCETDPVHVRWSSDDVLLYNLAVGAGQRDPLTELELTTENSEDTVLRPVPSFVVSLVQANSPKPYLGEYDPGDRLHGEQSFTLPAPLPAQGTAVLTTRVTEIFDQGSGALANLDTTLRCPDTGAVLAETRMGTFVRGGGGFGGPRAPKTSWALPDRPPDRELDIPVRGDQALIYRLCGDRNPLHSDPAFAKRAGFDRPILHGLCTFGIACRNLEPVCGQPLSALSARFVKPVIPGERLRLRFWDGVGFQVLDDSDAVVLDRGTVG